VRDPAGLLSIRPAVAADVPALVGLLVAGAVPGTAEDKEDTTDTGPYRAALAEIEAAGGAVLVAEQRGVVVGMCQLLVFRHFQGRGGRCAELESVHVRTDRRQRGIGRALVRAAVDEAQSRGCYRGPADLERRARGRPPLLSGSGLRAHACRIQAAAALSPAACVLNVIV
jgi:L-amino acid N-acyltransferase YncA